MYDICVLYKNSTFRIIGHPYNKHYKKPVYLLEISSKGDMVWIYLETLAEGTEVHPESRLYCHVKFDNVFPGKVLVYDNMKPERLKEKLLMSASVTKLDSYYSRLKSSASQAVLASFTNEHKGRVNAMVKNFVENKSLGPSTSSGVC